jgi:hypothetical protein
LAGRFAAIGARIDALSHRALFAWVVFPLLVLYLATATWSGGYHIDPFTNNLSAWSLGTRGTLLLDDHVALATPEYFSNIAWVVPARDSAASQYAPGTAIYGAPFYAIWPQDAELRLMHGVVPGVPDIEILVPPVAPAAIAAALAVAFAMGFLALTFRRFTGPRLALGAAYVAGLGTTAWSVAADALWQHGPGMMWIALGLALCVDHLVSSGFAFGAAVLTRPHTALIPAATGIYQSIKRRSLRPALWIGLGSSAGLAALLAINDRVFGEPSISGGYPSSFRERALSLDIPHFLWNVLGALFGPLHGLLIWSPFLIVLIPGLRAAWRAAPGWVKGASLGGVLYLLLQLKANRYTGGGGFAAYRYPLEALTAAAPLLLLAYTEWVAKRPRAARIFSFTVKASICIQAVYALVF